MEEHCSCLLDDVSDSFLHFAILVMRSDTTERDGLSLFLDMFSEECVSKPAIVCMIMLDGDIMAGCKTFEGFLGFDCLFGSVAWSHMDKGEVRMMVHKDSCGVMPLSCEPTFDLSNETWG